jgi:predicted metalloprotease with PDZ domain
MHPAGLSLPLCPFVYQLIRHRYLSLFILFLFYAVSASAEAPLSLKYTIHPLAQESVVTLAFQSGKETTTEIWIPLSYKGESLEEIRDIECSSHGCMLDTIREKATIKIFHDPYEEITIKYCVRMEHRDGTEEDLPPIIQEETFFQFFGDSFFLMPKIDPYEKIAITLEWKGIPADWTIANSFGIGEHQQQIFSSLSSLRLAVYIGGKIALLRSGDEDNAFYIAAQENYLIPIERINHLLKAIILEQRRFWNDFDFPHFLILFLPIERENFIHGEAKLNAFIIYSSDLVTATEKEWKGLAWALSHEHFHTWNPFKMLPAFHENFEDLSWFIEGFTDYYAGITAYRAHLLDLNDCIQETNHHLYLYYTSAVRNVTNEELQKKRWTNRSMQLLPYQRGYLLALLWDEKIRKASKGENSLDDVMKTLLYKTQTENHFFSALDIAEAAQNYLGGEAILDIQAYVLEGATLTPPTALFGHECAIEWIKTPESNDELIPQYRLK